MTQYTDISGLDNDTFYGIKFKVLDLGKIHIQMCQPGAGESPQKRFLEEKGEGVFHISFTVPDIGEADEKAKALGLSMLMTGRREDGKGFSFFDSLEQGGGVVLANRSR